MFKNSWQIMACPRVNLTMDVWSASVRRLKHVNTSLQIVEERTGKRSGQVVYALLTVNGKVGLAWDWVDVRPNVAVLADPMTIVSNVLLRTPDGEIASEFARLVTLAQAIYNIGWQSMVFHVEDKTCMAKVAKEA